MMQKNSMSSFQETYYTETLDNGLKVVIFHKPDFVSSACVFATPYGSLDCIQMVDGKKISIHQGAAHFLEHKLFEDEDKDVMGLFSAMGASVNAFTSYQETAYYFTSGANDIREPLNALLDFVQKLNITQASVDKEKGIITQELMMYQQMPDMRVLQEVLAAIFKKYPLNTDIGGTPESVSKTMVSELKKTYQLNYHPANMILVIVSGQNPEELMATIKENQRQKEFTEFKKPVRFNYNEQAKVFKKKNEISMDVHSTRVALGFKLPVFEGDDLEREKTEWAMRFILDAYFSSNNAIYQKWYDEGLITDYFGYETDIDKEYGILLFFNETEDPQAFKKLILNRLKKINVEKMKPKTWTQLANRYYGQAIVSLDNPEDLAISYIRSVFRNVDFFKSLTLPQSITLEDLKKAYEYMTSGDVTVVSITPKKVED